MLKTSQDTVRLAPRPAVLWCALIAVTMAYGWGYRGTVGHEAGAMVPGALLGLTLCLGSGRLDWHRRAALVGLFAAAGWAWGGQLSYMEHTFYIQSDSFLDVLYGYAMLFFLGALWAGCGAAILGLALTESRSELETLIRPFIAMSGVFLAVYLYFLLNPEHKEAYETFTVVYFHDGDWLAATLTLATSIIYWFARPADRRGTALFFWAALAWWIGYGLLTKIAGLRLAPLHRSESWGGVLGILIVLIIHLIRRENRAALMLCAYACLGGGLAFALAVMIHHPFALRLGPLKNTNLHVPAWRIAEISFGFMMGLALALGARRWRRGGLAPPSEDRRRTPTDTFAVFAITIALIWMNFRRHFARVLRQTPSTPENALLALPTGAWYFILMAMLTLPALYVLYRYLRGDRNLVPPSPFGKGATVTLMLIWVTVSGQLLDGPHSRQTLWTNLCLWLPAAIATCLLISFAPTAADAIVPPDANTSKADPSWRVGRRFALLCAAIPFVLLANTALSLAWQDASPAGPGRLRFGPNAYWRQTARLRGSWKAVGIAEDLDTAPAQSENLPLSQLQFDTYRNALSISPSGQRVAQHRWFLKNQYIWLHWFAKLSNHPQRAEVPLHFQFGRLYIAWPPHDKSEGYLVLERADDEPN